MGEFENFLMIIKDDSPYVSDIFVGANDKKLIGSLMQINKIYLK